MSDSEFARRVLIWRVDKTHNNDRVISDTSPRRRWFRETSAVRVPHAHQNMTTICSQVEYQMEAENWPWLTTPK